MKSETGKQAPGQFPDRTQETELESLRGDISQVRARLKLLQKAFAPDRPVAEATNILGQQQINRTRYEQVTLGEDVPSLEQIRPKDQKPNISLASYQTLAAQKQELQAVTHNEIDRLVASNRLLTQQNEVYRGENERLVQEMGQMHAMNVQLLEQTREYQQECQRLVEENRRLRGILSVQQADARTCGQRLQQGISLLDEFTK